MWTGAGMLVAVRLLLVINAGLDLSRAGLDIKSLTNTMTIAAKY